MDATFEARSKLSRVHKVLIVVGLGWDQDLVFQYYSHGATELPLLWSTIGFTMTILSSVRIAVLASSVPPPSSVCLSFSRSRVLLSLGGLWCKVRYEASTCAARTRTFHKNRFCWFQKHFQRHHIRPNSKHAKKCHVLPFSKALQQSTLWMYGHWRYMMLLWRVSYRRFDDWWDSMVRFWSLNKRCIPVPLTRMRSMDA